MSNTISEDRRHKLKEHAPAAKLVYIVLEQHGRALSLSDIADRTFLPESTARTAVNDLAEDGLVEKSTDVRDARKHRYEICKSGTEETAK